MASHFNGTPKEVRLVKNSLKNRTNQTDLNLIPDCNFDNSNDSILKVTFSILCRSEKGEFMGTLYYTITYNTHPSQDTTEIDVLFPFVKDGITTAIRRANVELAKKYNENIQFPQMTDENIWEEFSRIYNEQDED